MTQKWLQAFGAVWEWVSNSPASKEVVEKVEKYKQEYWITCVENNHNKIERDLGITIQYPLCEEDAKDLYHRWCHKLDELEAVTEKIRTNCSAPVENKALSKAITGSCQTARVEFENLRTAQPVAKIWVYNVSRMTLKADHPTLGQISIPGNTTRKRYSLWTSFPNTIMLPKQVEDSSGVFNTVTYLTSGLRFVEDLIKPDCLYHGSIRGGTYPKISIGRDFGEMGVFYSYHNPPLKAEVDEAVQRMEKRYRLLLEKTNELYLGSMSDMKRAKALMKDNAEKRRENKEIPEMTIAEAYEQSRLYRFQDVLTPEIHAAAEYFKFYTPWHPFKGCGVK